MCFPHMTSFPFCAVFFPIHVGTLDTLRQILYHFRKVGENYAEVARQLDGVLYTKRYCA